MIKTSVKRPFLVLVGVIMVIVLGIVSFTKIKTDLIPSINMPYVTIVTTYPGASPQRVETDVTDVVENTVGTVSGVKNMTSISGENYSMVELEFDENDDIEDCASKVSRTLENITLPDNAGKPMVIEISSDMMATMYVGVSRDNTDIYDLTDFTRNEIIPELKRNNGVASVSSTGAVTQSVEVRLNQDKIDEINNKILGQVNKSLADAKDKLDQSRKQLQDSKDKVASGREELSKQQDKQSDEMAKYSKQLDSAMATQAACQSQLNSIKAQKAGLQAEKNQYQSSYDQMDASIKTIRSTAGPGAAFLPSGIEEAAADSSKLAVLVNVMKQAGQDQAAAGFTTENLQMLVNGVNKRIPEINSELDNLNTEEAAAQAMADQVDKSVSKASSAYEDVEKGKITAAAAFGENAAKLDAAETQLQSSEKELDDAEKTYKDSAKAARKSANLDTLLDMDTLSGLLAAQNFDMPAGYISDDKTQYLLKVGDELSSVDELKDLVLCKADGVGDVKLSDVADITMIDDSEENYARINGNKAILLAITKGSTAFTSDVSDSCNATLDKLASKYKGLHFLNVMDQGDYIDMIVHSVMSNLIYGAILAIIVLFLFLWDWRPTLIVGFSIPLSVLFAIVMMYFTGITFNAISLSGLSLGIGMLVDNSIVSLENIYRLRSEGVPAARAAVAGAKQIVGAVTSSTLTTICVFLPMLFTDGITRQLLTDMCLTIAYSLIASLIVALTVVPSMSATMFRNSKPREHRFFEKFVNGYEKLLRFCLRRKAVPLLIALVLLIFSAVEVFRMGIVIFPETASNQLSASVSMEDDMDNRECEETADDMLKQVSDIKGVSDVGVMSSGGVMSLLGIDGVSNGSVRNMQFYVTLKDGYEHQNKRVAKDIEKVFGKYKLKDFSVSASNMNMSAVTGSGLEVDIEGTDQDKILAVSKDVMKMVEDNGSFKDISNGQEQADPQIELVIDKNKAARDGLTIGQIYQDLSKSLTDSKDATTLHVNDKDYTVTLVNEADKLTYDDLMNYQLETTTKDSEGKDVTRKHKLSKYATVKNSESLASIMHDNEEQYMSVTASPKDGKNVTLASRDLQKVIDKYDKPEGIDIRIAGETQNTDEIVHNMLLMVLLGFIFIYLIMVAQFSSLLSPFIVIFTVPLAFTGGLIALLVSGNQLSLLSMMGFLILMGVVVNNGIVYVDFVNQMRASGMEKHKALIEAGRTRIRPILMTALTTILAMLTTVFSPDMGSDLGRGMSIVVVGGLTYATFMTLLVVPVLYDILFRREVRTLDIDE